MSIWAAIPGILQTVGGLFRGGAANTVARLTGGQVVRGAGAASATTASVVPRAIVGGAIGSVIGPGLAGAAGTGLVSAGQGLQRLSGQGGMMGVRKKRRSKGISGAELRGFRRVYNFLESHCEPSLKVKRKRKCR